MAVKGFIRVEGKAIGRNDIVGYWELEQGDTATALEVPRYSDKSVMAFGNWSGSPTVALKQTNDPDLGTFGDALDIELTAISFTEDSDVRPILPNAYAIKPEITGGDSSTSVKIAIVGHGASK